VLAKTSDSEVPMSALRLPALRIEQGPSRTLFSFAVDGKRIPDFAAVSRLRRTEAASVLGYQRPEVTSHIGEIRDYLESDRPMIPNAIVVAFDDSVTFRPLEGQGSGPLIQGTLVIPLRSGGDSQKPGWIVDGQQRVAAIREARIDSFPVTVVGFVAPDLAEQKAQFILVNSTKPLPKGLIYELLPSTDGQLPSALERRKFPAFLLDRLNRDADSPLRGMVRTPTNGAGVIQDNSILRMLEHSLTDGALYKHNLMGDVEGSVSEPMLSVVKSFWAAAASTFPHAWGLPPRRSRLMHGAGVVSMGFLMDAIADRYRNTAPDQPLFERELSPLKAVCRWTDGYWEFGPGQHRKWNELQNTNKDVQLLTNYLMVKYRERAQSVPGGDGTA
jgi:DGQHR domain-containing protein